MTYEYETYIIYNFRCNVYKSFMEKWKTITYIVWICCVSDTNLVHITHVYVTSLDWECLDVDGSWLRDCDPTCCLEFGF